MSRRKPRHGEVYPTYQPYPVSRDSERELYSSAGAQDVQTPRPPPREPESADDFPDLIGDPTPAEWYSSRPPTSNAENGFRALRLLQSLFADRLDFLRAALSELQEDRAKRERLTATALDDIDFHIAECDRELSLLKGALNDFDRRKHLQRQLLELKRQRRQESVMSWRDLLALKREIRALKREIESLNGTARAARKRDAPT